MLQFELDANGMRCASCGLIKRPYLFRHLRWVQNKPEPVHLLTDICRHCERKRVLALPPQEMRAMAGNGMGYIYPAEVDIEIARRAALRRAKLSQRAAIWGTPGRKKKGAEDEPHPKDFSAPNGRLVRCRALLMGLSKELTTAGRHASAHRQAGRALAAHYYETLYLPCLRKLRDRLSAGLRDVPPRLIPSDWWELVTYRQRDLLADAWMDHVPEEERVKEKWAPAPVSKHLMQRREAMPPEHVVAALIGSKEKRIKKPKGTPPVTGYTHEEIAARWKKELEQHAKLKRQHEDERPGRAYVLNKLADELNTDEEQ